MARTANCKHCGKAIEFLNLDGKWKPCDPQTGELHKCDMDMVCESCGVTFKGAPWMGECSLCYRGELRKGRAWKEKDPVPPRKAEKLEDPDDGSTPF